MAWEHESDPGSVLVGLSRGTGVPSPFFETDLSENYVGVGDPNDQDGDNLPDTWENFYFGSYTNCEPSGHGDIDGVDNQGEYIAGTDPTDPASYFSVNTVQSGSDLILNWYCLTGRTYSVQHNSSIGAPLTNLATDLVYPQNTFTSSVDAADSGFFKVNVEMTTP